MSAPSSTSTQRSELETASPDVGLSLSAFGSSKITHRHHDRLAIVYVRQSDPQQVLQHRESRELQYNLVNRAVALGWPRERVLVIDEDQGQSAQSAAVCATTLPQPRQRGGNSAFSANPERPRSPRRISDCGIMTEVSGQDRTGVKCLDSASV